MSKSCQKSPKNVNRKDDILPVVVEALGTLALI